MTRTTPQDVSPPWPLFDPSRGELPPRDAVEVYLEPPPSVSLLHTHCDPTDEVDRVSMEHLEEAWAAGQAAALDTLLRNLQLKVGQHYDRPGLPSVGQYLPGRLYVTHVPHLRVPGSQSGTQMHDHFYIGPTGIPDEARCVSMAGTPLLSPSDAGREWPVSFSGLRSQVASILDALYELAIQRELTARNGTMWLPGQGRGPVVAAQCMDLVDSFPRIICPGLPQAGGPPPSRERRVAAALAAEPDASEERRWELHLGIGLPEPPRVERMIIRDIIDPPRYDPYADEGPYYR